ncbi:type II toxin-antitoxin system VapC family toxin [Paramicrobacterium agarici]|uniref:type II toxin-antitoxin system VapC family toxin n=1 Tax=Paramicrobacterium agarici TaxID=630514 RepID=UPI00114E23A3|nr:PIN domain-containing protein [Microbacterium agarici]TQO22657.1 PIN domain-containing protein [Microbacterium agarici]
MIVLDASVVIAVLTHDDQHHDQADSFFRATVSNGYLMHSLTLAEILVGPVRARRETLALRAIDGLGISEWSPGERSASRLATLRAETSLKLPDCCVLDAALETSSSLATFDEKIATAARALGVDVFSHDRR